MLPAMMPAMMPALGEQGDRGECHEDGEGEKVTEDCRDDHDENLSPVGVPKEPKPVS